MSQCKKGFTLVELLVVIGIIGLLIAILLPALNKARQQAYTVQCQSNMRQVLTGFVFYADQYNGSLPYQHIVGDFDWSRTILSAMIGEGKMPNSKTGSPQGLSADYFRCPLDFQHRTLPNYPDSQARSYAINSDDTNPQNYFLNTVNGKYSYPFPYVSFSPAVYAPPCKLSQIPAKVFLIGENWDRIPYYGPQAYIGQNTDAYLQDWYSEAHPSTNGAGGNYAYGDGHVEFHIPKEFRIDLTSGSWAQAALAGTNMIGMQTDTYSLGILGRDPTKWVGKQ